MYYKVWGCTTTTSTSQIDATIPSVVLPVPPPAVRPPPHISSWWIMPGGAIQSSWCHDTVTIGFRTLGRARPAAVFLTVRGWNFGCSSSTPCMNNEMKTYWCWSVKEYKWQNRPISKLNDGHSAQADSAGWAEISGSTYLKSWSWKNFFFEDPFDFTSVRKKRFARQ
jgi:hypothetical protein